MLWRFGCGDGLFEKMGHGKEMIIECDSIRKAPRHQDMDPEMMKDFANLILDFGSEEDNGLANTDNDDNNSH